MHEREKRIKSWLSGTPAPPWMLDINPTDQCNLVCRSCWMRDTRFKSRNKSYELPDRKWLEITEEALRMGVKYFEITGGGEPLLRKKLVVNCIEKVIDASGKGNITTNGTLITQDLAELFVSRRWTSITISLDGPDATTHNYLRGRKNAFQQTINAIILLNEEKKRKNSPFPSIKLNCVLSQPNAHKMTEMIELAKLVEAEFLSIAPMTVHSKEGEAIKLHDPENTHKQLRHAARYAENRGVSTNLQNITKRVLTSPNNMNQLIQTSLTTAACFEPFWHLVLKVNGAANPCCIFDVQHENVRTHSLKEIWYGKLFGKLRTAMRNKSLFGACQKCNAGQLQQNKEINEALIYAG